jgi:hypothetical protein
MKTSTTQFIETPAIFRVSDSIKGLASNSWSAEIEI